MSDAGLLALNYPTALAVWLHDWDPFIVRFPASWPIDGLRWYGMAYLVGFAGGWWLIRRMCLRPGSPLPADRALDLVVTLAVGILLGGRLGYVVFYRPDLLWSFMPAAPWWGVLAVNEGGMASHGGMIGGSLAAWWFAWRSGVRLGHITDLLALGFGPGVFLGRIANFINGELIGRPSSPQLPWAVRFPQAIYDWAIERREALYRRLPDSALFELPADYWRSVGSRPGEVFWHPGAVIELVQRGHEGVRAVIEPMLEPRHPSQLYAAVLEGLVLLALSLWLWRTPWARRRAGVVTGAGLCVYGVMRFVNEFFRRPDAHLLNREFAVTGLSRGQWLSVAVLLVGGWVLYRTVCQRRGSE